MAYRLLHVGAGGFGEVWCRDFLPPNIADGTVEVVGLLDVDRQALRTGARHLGLPESACFTDPAEAFSRTRADVCSIVVPPQFHERYVDLAIAHGLHILSEKPIADTMEGAARIVRKVKSSGLKMAVTMSHRFDQDKTTLLAFARSAMGRLSEVSCRYLGDFRAWKLEQVPPRDGASAPDRRRRPPSRHHRRSRRIGMPLHLCARWIPPWAQYAGESDAIVVMDFENGARGLYEGSSSHSTGLNDWTQEYFRIDGEFASAVLDHREVEVFARQPDWPTRQKSRHGFGQKLPALPGAKWSNTLLIEQFARWLDGGPAMETNVEANLRSVVLVFGAVESVRTGQPVDLREFAARYAAQ